MLWMAISLFSCGFISAWWEPAVVIFLLVVVWLY